MRAERTKQEAAGEAVAETLEASAPARAKAAAAELDGVPNAARPDRTQVQSGTVAAAAIPRTSEALRSADALLEQIASPFSPEASSGGGAEAAAERVVQQVFAPVIQAAERAVLAVTGERTSALLTPEAVAQGGEAELGAVTPAIAAEPDLDGAAHATAPASGAPASSTASGASAAPSVASEAVRAALAEAAVAAPALDAALVKVEEAAEAVAPAATAQTKAGAAPQSEAAAPASTRPEARPEAKAAPDQEAARSEPLRSQPASFDTGEAAIEPAHADLPVAEPAAASSSSVAEARAAATPVRGAPETVANLAAEIARKLDARNSRFEVALDPAGLGMVNVSIDIGADGRLSAQMAFERPEAAAELRSRAAELQRALEQAGFDLSKGGLSFNGEGARERAGGDQPRREQARAHAFQQALLQAEAADTLPAQPLRLRSRGGLDVRI